MCLTNELSVLLLSLQCVDEVLMSALPVQEEGKNN